MPPNLKSPPTTLALDTGHTRCQCALAWGEHEAQSSVIELARGHAEIIMGQIEALLAKTGLNYSRIDRLVTTTGPGSFTGLRVGLSVARAIGLGLEVPVLGIPTLMALSLSGPKDAPFCVAVDARRDEFYFQRFISPGQPQGDPEIVGLERLKNHIRPQEVVLGSGGAFAASEIGAIDAGVEFVDIMALARFAHLADPGRFPPRPLYVRAPDAKAPQGAPLVHQ